MLPNRIASRDAGLRRINRVTRWVLSAGVAFTIGLSALAARAYSGASPASPEIVAIGPVEATTTATTTTTTRPAASPGSAVATTTPTTAAPTTTTIQPPVQAPTSTTKKAKARSGGS